MENVGVIKMTKGEKKTVVIQWAVEFFTSNFNLPKIVYFFITYYR